MWVGSRLAAVCLASMSGDDQARVLDRLAASGHEVIDLGYDQLESFAGNMLELRNRDGEPVIAMSEQAFGSLDARQRGRLEHHAARGVRDRSHREAVRRLGALHARRGAPAPAGRRLSGRARHRHALQ